MSGIIPLPPEHFSLGKLVLEASICSRFPVRASFSSIPPRPAPLPGLGPFLHRGRKLQGQLCAVQARKIILIFFQWRNGAKIRDWQDIMVQTSFIGPVWKWFGLQSHQTILFLPWKVLGHPKPFHSCT